MSNINKYEERPGVNITISKKSVFMVIGILLLIVIAFTIGKGLSQPANQGNDLSNSAPAAAGNQATTGQSTESDPYANNATGIVTSGNGSSGPYVDNSGATTSDSNYGGAASTGSSYSGTSASGTDNTGGTYSNATGLGSTGSLTGGQGVATGVGAADADGDNDDD